MLLNFFKKVKLAAADSCVKTETPRVRLNVMAVADTHGHLQKEDVTGKWKDDIDVVFMLGDIFPNDIKIILDATPEIVPIYAVTGNHDSKNLLDAYDRLNHISGKRIEQDNYSVTGLSGSIRYKPDSYFSLISNEESEKILSDVGHADILMAHDMPCFSAPKTITAYSGLTGIGKYIIEKKPEIVLNGHTHEPCIKRYRNTIIRCIYGVEVFTIAF